MSAVPIDRYADRCGSCAAFVRARDDDTLGRVGECGLEIFRGPVQAGSTCTRYRPKGALSAKVRPRAAGEPRGQGHPAELRSPKPRRHVHEKMVERRPLPKEIDIDMDIEQFREVLREVLSEELGIGEVELGARWQGGELLLKPGSEDTQPKSIPIETFFHKIVMVRDKLRVLEAKLNAHKGLSDEDKVQLQSYVTGCYGSLTTFNILFAKKSDEFSKKR